MGKTVQKEEEGRKTGRGNEEVDSGILPDLGTYKIQMGERQCEKKGREVRVWERESMGEENVERRGGNERVNGEKQGVVTSSTTLRLRQIL